MGELSAEELIDTVHDPIGANKAILRLLWAKIEELEQDIIDLSAKQNRQERQFRSKFTD